MGCVKGGRETIRGSQGENRKWRREIIRRIQGENRKERREWDWETERNN